MRKIYQFAAVVVIIATLYVSAPIQAKAQAGGAMPFGGLISYFQPCTCSAPYMWLFMVPLHLNTAAPIVGPLVYNPAQVIPGNGLYAEYSVRPGAWLLGKYTPGVQSCQIYVGTGCVILPSLGEITMTGTSR